MRKIFLALLIASLCSSALADGPPFSISPPFVPSNSVVNSTISATATGTSAARTLAARFADRINVKDTGAIADELDYTDGTVAASSTAFSSASATFAAADVGKTIEIDGVGASLTGAPLVTTIAGFIDVHDVTLGASSTLASGLSYLTAISLINVGSDTGSYQPGETVTLTGGTSTVGAVAKILSVKVRASSVTINAGGTGGTATSTCTVIGNDSTVTGTQFQLSVTISGGAITVINSVSATGHVESNPASITAYPVTPVNGAGCGSLTGATVGLSFDPDVMSVNTAGSYSVTPGATGVATGAGSISGATGATVSATWVANGSFKYGTDNNAAFAAAWNAAINRMSLGDRACVYIPAGAYYVGAGSGALPLFNQQPGCVFGDGVNESAIVLGANYVGDFASWSEAWTASGVQFNGATQGNSGFQAGPVAADFSVTGTRRAGSQQNGLHFYDREDFVYVRNVKFNYLNGSCFYSGDLKNKTQAYMRESHIEGFRAWNCGTSGTADVMVFDSHGGAGTDGTNEIDVLNTDIFANYGNGFVITNNCSAAACTIRDIKTSALRIEGLQWNAANITGDLYVIGKSSDTGVINTIMNDKLELIDPYNANSGLHIGAPSGQQPYFISCTQCQILGGVPLGGGLKIDSGRNLSMDFKSFTSYATNFTVASTASGTGAYLVFNLAGRETSATWSVDSSEVTNVLTPTFFTGNPSASAQKLILPNVSNNSGTADIYNTGLGTIIFETAGNPVGSVNQNGTWQFGATNNNFSVLNAGAFPKFQFFNAGSANGANGIFVQSYQNAIARPAYYFCGQSNSSTLGTQAAVASGNQLCIFDAEGSDGTHFQSGIQHRIVAAGTISSGIVPGAEAVYATPNGSATQVEVGLLAGTKATLSGGCSTGTTVGHGTAGKFTSSTTGTCAFTVTINGAAGLPSGVQPNGWSCWSYDRTTPGNLISQNGDSATTATFTGTTASGDIVSWGCVPY